MNVKSKAHMFRVCEYCGARLDPGEHCDCRQAKADRKPEKTSIKKPNRREAI